VTLKDSGADVFFSITTPKFAAMALRKVAAMDWKVTQYLASVSTSMKAVVLPAGPEAVKGVISATYVPDPGDPNWQKTPAYAEFLEVTRKYGAAGDETDNLSVSGMMIGEMVVQTLRQCGDDLSRENVMRQAANLDFAPKAMMPGIRVKTGPDDYAPIEQMQPIRFDGTRWVPFGEVLGR
jgi:hypothetical protein